MSDRSPEDDEIVRRAADVILAQIPEDGSLARLSPQRRTFALVYWAQPLIDNGGFGMFFDCECPGQPSYGDFANAYREIEAPEMATLVERGAALFRFRDPHLHPEKRHKVFEKYLDTEDGSPGMT